MIKPKCWVLDLLITQHNTKTKLKSEQNTKNGANFFISVWPFCTVHRLKSQNRKPCITLQEVHQNIYCKLQTIANNELWLQKGKQASPANDANLTGPKARAPPPSPCPPSMKNDTSFAHPHTVPSLFIALSASTKTLQSLKTSLQSYQTTHRR